jgi:Coenzyme PQQ synthesis protein D (PqqD)
MTQDTLDVGPAAEFRASVPKHVVYRSFPSETVLLNLNTGTYHGLNATAGRLLEELERAATIGAAAEIVAAEWGQPPSLVERDARELCQALLERDLIQVDEPPQVG